MTQYLSDTDFDSLKRRLNAGKANIAVPRQVARQFFARVANDEVISATGQSIAVKKAFLYLLFIGSIGLFLACLGLILITFKWGATLAIPAVGIFWAILTVLTSDKGNQWIGLAGLLISIAPLYFMSESYSVPLALFGVSIWLHRWLYFLSQYWLEKLVSSSYEAFDMMAEHIEINDPEAQASMPEHKNSREQLQGD